MSGKGDKRRNEDGKKVRDNWDDIFRKDPPYDKLKELKHSAEVSKKLADKDGNINARFK